MPVALDGFVSNSVTSSPLTLSLTTTGGSGYIICEAGFAGISSTGVPTATGLTFTQRLNLTSNLYEWYAPYSSNFSGTISIGFSGGGTCAGCAFGVSGATGFDTNVSLPGTNSTGGSSPGGAASGSTSGSNNFIFAIYTTGDIAGPGTGWTCPNTPNTYSNFTMPEYKIVSSPQSSLVGTYTNTVNLGLFDSLVGASSSFVEFSQTFEPAPSFQRIVSFAGVDLSGIDFRGVYDPAIARQIQASPSPPMIGC